MNYIYVYRDVSDCTLCYVCGERPMCYDCAEVSGCDKCKDNYPDSVELPRGRYAPLQGAHRPD